MIGSTIAHYRIIRKLGEGGMGEVFLAQDTRLDRRVALKILRRDAATDPDRHARFLQEAKAVSALDHPNIAHLYEIGESEGLRFISMQYLDGRTLSTRIKEGQLQVQEILDIAIQAAGALEEAHSKGIVHRDIKPANIMITSRGLVKVLDFGIAKILPGSHALTKSTGEPVTGEGIALGTVFYLSPEQALENPVDHRSDIFSLGVVLYEMATGVLPFRGGTTMETINAILNSTSDAPGIRNPHIPWELERIILKCLEKQVPRRYQSAGELQSDLQHLEDDLASGPARTRRTHLKRRFSFRLYASIAVLALIALGIAAWYSSSRNSQTIHSLAVLPFLNEGSDPGTEYLSDGITDSTINTLSQLPGIKVLARGTVFTYKGKETDPRKLGKELDVDAIVTGTIFQKDERLSIQVSLVKTSDGAQIWGKRYDSAFSDILTVHTEISGEISSELRLTLTGRQQKQLAKQFTGNVEAYRLYLKGRYYLNKRTEMDFHKAIQSFEQAIALDPQYALPYAGLADSYALLSNWGYLPASEGYRKSRQAALKALAIDNTLAEAHTSLASVTASYDWNWQKAEQDFQRAIELNPNYATAHFWYSIYLSQVGRHQQAIKEIQIAQRLDPLSLVISSNYGYTLYLARQYDEALKKLQQTFQLDDRFALAYQYLGYVLEQNNRPGEAVRALETAVSISPESPSFKADLARACAVAGDRARAKSILEALLDPARTRYVPSYDIANIYIGLGDPDGAFEWLEKAYEERSDVVTYIKMEPRMDPLRSDPRFADLLHRIGL